MGEAHITIVDASQPDLIGRSWSTDDEGNHFTIEDLSFRRVIEVNARRCVRWHDPTTDAWTGADWSNAMCGEAGETANVVKKLRRHGSSANRSLASFRTTNGRRCFRRNLCQVTILTCDLS